MIGNGMESFIQQRMQDRLRDADQERLVRAVATAERKRRLQGVGAEPTRVGQLRVGVVLAFLRRLA